jgi:glycosyltransferase involved in cell wall biosynthesis
MMGLETAEMRLLDTLRNRRSEIDVTVRVVGRRHAQAHARRIDAPWYPSIRGTSSRRAFRGADLIHLAGLTLAPPRRRPFVATFHDLSPFHYADETPLPPWGRAVAARAELLICPSWFTAAELQEQLGVAGERIRVIPNGPGAEVSPCTDPLSDDELRLLGLSRPFVLRVGGWTKRKNVPLLLDAWRRVEQQSPLTLALAGPPQRERDAQLAAHPLQRVHVLDYVPAPLFPGLLRAATALITTSTYEGFGLPALEGMTGGVPVVAFRAPFVEEVCGDAALLVDDAEGLAHAVLRIAQDAELRARLIAGGLARARLYTWDRAVDKLLDAYREVGDRYA